MGLLKRSFGPILRRLPGTVKGQRETNWFWCLACMAWYFFYQRMSCSALLIAAFLAAAFLPGCSYICGIDEEMQAILSRTAQAAPEGVRVERIPCEVNYLNAICTTPSIDTAGLVNLANYFWDEERGIGWQTLMVYDSQGELVYTVFKKDRIKRQQE